MDDDDDGILMMARGACCVIVCFICLTLSTHSKLDRHLVPAVTGEGGAPIVKN
jgi:hypothetical protein